MSGIMKKRAGITTIKIEGFNPGGYLLPSGSVLGCGVCLPVSVCCFVRI